MIGQHLYLWWGRELKLPDEWRWHMNYNDADHALERQQWHEYIAGVPARLIYPDRRGRG